MKKRMFFMIIALSVVFGGLFAFNIVRSYMVANYFKNFSAPTVTVSTTKTKQTTWYPNLAAVANFVAIQGVDVSAEAGGNVTNIYFKSGEAVKKGAKLVSIDDSVDQATLKDAKAKLDLYKITYSRQAHLLRQQATSSSNVDEAKANLREAKALVEKTQALIKQKHITAPFDGRLGVRLVNLGEYVSPGTTKIVTLQSQDPLYLRFFLPEKYLNKLHVNQNIRFSVEAYPNHLFSGHITAINSKINAENHNLLLQAAVDNCPKAMNDKRKDIVDIRFDDKSNSKVTFCSHKKNQQANIKHFSFVPGMFANVDVILPTLEKVIVLPRSAIAYSLYGNSVFVVREETDKKSKRKVKKVYQQFVTTGEERGNQVVILNGLKDGEEVVNSGQLKLHNGTPVDINNSVELHKTVNPDTLGQ